MRIFSLALLPLALACSPGGGSLGSAGAAITAKPKMKFTYSPPLAWTYNKEASGGQSLNEEAAQSRINADIEYAVIKAVEAYGFSTTGVMVENAVKPDGPFTLLAPGVQCNTERCVPVAPTCEALCARGDQDCVCEGLRTCQATCTKGDPGCGCSGRTCVATCTNGDPGCMCHDDNGQEVCEATCNEGDDDCICTGVETCVAACTDGDPGCTCTGDEDCRAPCLDGEPNCVCSGGKTCPETRRRSPTKSVRQRNWRSVFRRPSQKRGVRRIFADDPVDPAAPPSTEGSYVTDGGAVIKKCLAGKDEVFQHKDVTITITSPVPLSLNSWDNIASKVWATLTSSAGVKFHGLINISV